MASESDHGGGRARAGHGIPRGSDVAGVITKEHVADSVADSIKAFPR